MSFYPTTRSGRIIRPVNRLTANDVWIAAHEEADPSDDDSGCETPEEDEKEGGEEIDSMEDFIVDDEAPIEYDAEILLSEEEEEEATVTEEEEEFDESVLMSD